MMTEPYPERYPQDDTSEPETDLPDSAFDSDAPPANDDLQP